MARRVVVLASLLLVGLSAPRPLVACGDKFLLPPRGLSFDEAYRAAHPGAILIYAPSGATASEYTKVQTMLTRAGHHVALVKEAGQVSQALAKADIVLTSLSDAGVISSQAGASRTAPLILPVLTRPTKADTAACKLKYPCDLKSTDKPERFVVAINMAMNDRVKALGLKHGD